jgi:hypothetical protein
MMLGDPRVGTPSYSEGWAPSVPWTDRATVYQTGQKTCVPADCYEDVLVIEETSREEPDARHLKYYARGIGVVRVGWRGEFKGTKEKLELVKVEQLSSAGLSEARAAALKLDKNAYSRSKDVWGKTPPAEPAPGAEGQ